MLKKDYTVTMEEKINEIKKSPENVGVVLWLECYEKGVRSAREMNDQLSIHYEKPIVMTREEICAELKKRAQMFALPFNGDDITE